MYLEKKKKVVAIVGSYRKGKVTDAAVEAVLEGARKYGAETHTIHLMDQHLEFCKNCRECAQTPGPERGKCQQHDDLESILTEIEAADAVVLGTAVNYGSVTAVFRKFMERLTGFSYWPWGETMPKMRKPRTRKAVLVASSGMPGFFIPLFTDVASTLRWTAKLLGAKPIGHLWVGRSAWQPACRLTEKQVQHARHIGAKLLA
jgi:NAD(P)H-dependent FMN reductase